MAASEQKLNKIFDQNVEITGTLTVNGTVADLSNYLTSFTETDPTVPSHVKSITTTNISNWNTAYGWGNHADAGYLTSYTETDTLATVTARGATTSDAVGFSSTGLQLSGHWYNGFYSGTTNYIHLYPNGHSGGASVTNIRAWNGTSYDQLVITGGNDSIVWRNKTLIHSGNITSYALTSETDTLDSVADRGRTTNQQLISTNPAGFRVDSGSYARIELDSTDNWSYIRMQDQGTVTWDIACYNSGNLEWRPGGGATNRTQLTTGGAFLVNEIWPQTSSNSARFTGANDWGTRHYTSNGYIQFGPANNDWAHIYTDRPNFYFNKELYVNGYKVFHYGNDGAGSGLTADTVDGYHASGLVRVGENLFSDNTSDDTTGPINFVRNGSLGWDDYVIKHGSSKGLFGKKGVAWHAHTDSSFHVMSSGWVSNFGVNSDGTTISRGSSRAPIFYDYNDTSYYADPGSTSNFNGLNVNSFGGHIDAAVTAFYVYGDQNTYYPVIIEGAAGYTYQRYSIGRRYSWTAPWDPIGTGSHKGGLTFAFEWSGDTAWGGNYKDIRVIDFGESYTTMVGGLSLPVTGGVCVWLRGGGTGGAYYQLRAPKGAEHGYTIYDGYSGSGHSTSTTFTAGNGATYSARTSPVSSEIESRWPLRGDSNTLFVNSSAYSPIYYDSSSSSYYLDLGNTGTSLNTAGSARIRNIDISPSSAGDTIQHKDSGGNLWLQYNHNGTTGIGYGGGKTTMYSKAEVIGSANGNDPTLKITSTTSNSFNHAIEAFNSNLTSGEANIVLFGRTGNTKNSGYIGYEWIGDANNNNYVTIGHWGADHLFRVYPDQITGNSSFRAPIFYDLDNTSYYANPNGDSVFNRLRAAGAGNGWSIMCGGLDTGRVYNDSDRESVVINAPYYPHLYVNAQNGSNLNHGAVFSMTGAKTGGGFSRFSMGIPNLDPSVMTMGFYDNNTNPHYGCGGNYLGENTWGSVFWLDSSGNLQTSGSTRSPIFYDSNNTNYYCNPNGQSKFNNGGSQETLILEGEYPQLTIRKTSIPDASIHFDAGYAKKWNIGPGAGGAEEDEFGFAIYSGPRGTHYGTPLRINAETQNVMVGDADHPAYKLDVRGTIRATGDIIAYSDARVKENIKTIDNALNKVNALRGVEYNKIGDNNKSIGVIAQEVQKVLPEVVKIDDKDMMSVAYGNIVGVLIEAVKELSNKVEELENKLNGSIRTEA